MNSRVESLLSHSAEAVLALWPHRRPTAAQLAGARIVAHRGERDDRRVYENTIAAFDAPVAAGVQAIEFDVRYTRDDEPVVVHDADLRRVFGLPDRIADMSWQRLHERAPQVPHLAELIARYAPGTHLMIELKTRGNLAAEARLAELLSDLMPVRDFHMLSLDPALFAGVATMPAACRLPVAKFNLSTLFDWALTHDCAGLAGPHLLMRRHQIRTLRARRAVVGAGFVTRQAVLRREIARGVDWIFTNHPRRLQTALDAARVRAV